MKTNSKKPPSNTLVPSKDEKEASLEAEFLSVYSTYKQFVERQNKEMCSLLFKQRKDLLAFCEESGLPFETHSQYIDTAKFTDFASPEYEEIAGGYVYLPKNFLEKFKDVNLNILSKKFYSLASFNSAGESPVPGWRSSSDVKNC